MRADYSKGFIYMKEIRSRDRSPEETRAWCMEHPNHVMRMWDGTELGLHIDTRRTNFQLAGKIIGTWDRRRGGQIDSQVFLWARQVCFHPVGPPIACLHSTQIQALAIRPDATLLLCPWNECAVWALS